VLKRLEGAFALAIIFRGENDLMFGARMGAPLAVGHGDGQMFLGSDAIALAPFTNRVTYLEDGDWVALTRGSVEIIDAQGRRAVRPISTTQASAFLADRGKHKHFMAKEIAEQPEVVGHTLAEYVDFATGTVKLPRNLAFDFATLDKLTITACGTASYAGLVAKYWFERIARLPTEVDVASEFRYREAPLGKGGLSIVISQSGETADTLAALREAKQGGACSVSICNVVGSMATRETEGTIYTHAGPEIGVASTKAFTSQLVALYLLGLRLGQARGVLTPEASKPHIDALLQLPQLLEQTLKLAPEVSEIAARFHNRTDFLYLGRGINYPIALEGALKLKEISYIHAEGYPAGEMKHGPIALIDERMPVVTIAPVDEVFEKMIGNMQEAKARGGSVIALTTRGEHKLAAILEPGKDVILELPRAPELLTPIVMTLPLQLLAYDIAVRRGCDVDQPRNLAKSVTVE